MAASMKPLVLDSIDLVHFLLYILNTHGPESILIVCASRSTFSDELLSSMSNCSPTDIHAGQARAPLSPTLRTLTASRMLKVAFCPQLSHLRAFLATIACTRRIDGGENGAADRDPSLKPRCLAVLNPIRIHRQTASFSAQGLNRTFSGAIEAAYGSESRLILAEVPMGNDLDMSGSDLVDEHVSPSTSNEDPRGSRSPNSWDEEVSILGSTMRSFGTGERSWVGRTVTIRQIAERWCDVEEAQRFGVVN